MEASDSAKVSFTGQTCFQASVTAARKLADIEYLSMLLSLSPLVYNGGAIAALTCLFPTAKTKLKV